MEPDQLVARRPHPQHGRILRVTLTEEGQRRLDWLVEAAQRMEAAARDR